MQPTLLAQGLELLVYGMGTVVVFLTVLVYATGAMSRTVQRYFPQPEVAPARRAAAPREAPAATAISPVRLAVIAAAVHRYRQDHGS